MTDDDILCGKLNGDDRGCFRPKMHRGLCSFNTEPEGE